MSSSASDSSFAGSASSSSSAASPAARGGARGGRSARGCRGARGGRGGMRGGGACGRGGATGGRGGGLGDPMAIDSDSSPEPEAAVPADLPAIYHREVVDPVDPIVAEEMEEMGYDPEAPLAPLRVDELPRFGPEPTDRYLEAASMDLGLIGLFYPMAQFAVCRLPVGTNSTVTVSGEELARLGQLVRFEPFAQSAGGPLPVPAPFGVMLLRRDWPRGAVVSIPASQYHHEFVRRMLRTFARLRGREVLKIHRCEPVAGLVVDKYARAFEPAEGNPRPTDAEVEAWFNRHDGGRPVDWAPQNRMLLLLAAGPAPPLGPVGN